MNALSNAVFTAAAACGDRPAVVSSPCCADPAIVWICSFVRPSFCDRGREGGADLGDEDRAQQGDAEDAADLA